MNLIEFRRIAPELLDSVIESVVIEDYHGAIARCEELADHLAGLRKSLERRLKAKKENEGL